MNVLFDWKKKMFTNDTDQSTSTNVCTIFQQFSTYYFKKISVNGDDDDSDNTWSILHMSRSMKLMLEINLIISSMAMIITLIAYISLPHLRTVPGRCLMGIITSELAVNLFFFLALIIPPNSKRNFLCVTVSVMLHYFYLTILTWTNIIAYQIWWKIRYTTAKLRRISWKHFLFIYLTPLLLVIPGLCLQFSPVPNEMKPQYGWKYCAVSNLLFRILFYTIPAIISFCYSLVTFLKAIIKIRSSMNFIVTNANRSNPSNPSTVTQRLQRKNLFISYIKLSVLLGVLNFLSFAGNIFTEQCQMINFILMMVTCSHGFWIFMAFACKRSIFVGLKSHSKTTINSWIHRRSLTINVSGVASGGNAGGGAGGVSIFSIQTPEYVTHPVD